MRGNSYSVGGRRGRRDYKPLIIISAILIVGGLLVWKFLMPSPVEKAVNNLQFDPSVTEQEKQLITKSITDQKLSYDGEVTVSARTTTEPGGPHLLQAYLPVTGVYSSKQSAASAEITVQAESIPASPGTAPAADSSEVVLLPADQLNEKVKLLSLDGAYYLDSFNRGAVFRQAEFSGSGADGLSSLKLGGLPDKESTLKLNQTGVTALTRLMMRKLNSVGSATFFSDKIGAFLADADITHVSNEVSFKDGCTYNDILFCSPPAMLEALKASGVDVVELTGNHNNDVGAIYNTETINLYHSLGWGTFGGGLNTEEAAKPWLTDQKGTKLALLGYNYPDSPSGGAIADSEKAGANSFDFDRIKSDIKTAKDQGYYVIVDIQFWECYAYPDGYVEYPICDQPIPNQKEVFRQVADSGADMVVGSSAHQPQTYEIYNNTPVYYGLGNLYFDQTQWPGTERGIILTHYLAGGKLLQTKLTPTEYGTDYQTAPMSDEDAVWLLDRLGTGRTNAGL